MKGSELLRDLETRVSRIRSNLSYKLARRRLTGLHRHVDALYASYNEVTCHGWLFCGSKQVSSVELVLTQKGRRWSHEIEDGRLRTDVERHFGSEDARSSGFSGRVTVTDAKGKLEVFLSIEFEDGERALLFSGVVRIEAIEERILGNRRRYAEMKWPRNRHVALYTSSMGNYFFEEIRELLEAGFEACGYSVELRDETDGYANDADWNVIIAPHEFFYLGRGIELQGEETPLNLVFLNTEQPSTEWFSRAYNMFGHAYAIWDMSAASAAEFARSSGFDSYLPLGYVEGLSLFEEKKALPVHEGTCFLNPETLEGSHLDIPLEKRPIDIFFAGHASTRRQEFFAKHAAFFAQYDCYLHISPLGDPLIPGETTYMDSETVVGLEQRSKIVLNIHHGSDVYFEWHRMILHGIWQKALVVTEPCSGAPPFEANVDYVEVEQSAIPETLEYFLSTEQGRAEARIFAERAFKKLSEECRLTESLQRLLASLEPDATAAAPRVPVGAELSSK